MSGAKRGTVAGRCAGLESEYHGAFPLVVNHWCAFVDSKYASLLRNSCISDRLLRDSRLDLLFGVSPQHEAIHHHSVTQRHSLRWKRVLQKAVYNSELISKGFGEAGPRHTGVPLCESPHAKRCSSNQTCAPNSSEASARVEPTQIERNLSKKRGDL